jgi:hypothetical protein
VLNTDASVTVKADTNDNSSTMTINGQPVQSNAQFVVALGVPGSTTPISIVVTAQAGNGQTYNVTVNRPL